MGEWNTCSSCGARTPAPSAQPTGPSRCPHCGATQSASSKFPCPACGQLTEPWLACCHCGVALPQMTPAPASPLVSAAPPARATGSAPRRRAAAPGLWRVFVLPAIALAGVAWIANLPAVQKVVRKARVLQQVNEAQRRSDEAEEKNPTPRFAGVDLTADQRRAAEPEAIAMARRAWFEALATMVPEDQSPDGWRNQLPTLLEQRFPASETTCRWETPSSAEVRLAPVDGRLFQGRKVVSSYHDGAKLTVSERDRDALDSWLMVRLQHQKNGLVVVERWSQDTSPLPLPKPEH